ncbi:MFS transporter [Romboutsia lituseburensis]|uniref:Predicted arabinose efflux permease, MFS family n=3 Tax=Romboutsia lituseburensis TaxID=1537 RepID=A0A1G9J2M4_9FIRM|nr:MFS transporter [Romboutsia lituseburensis]SDL31748.1 Predicted arabinose efflux permease, MFS family [Romboutsia lituseburensis DSM 797]
MSKFKNINKNIYLFFAINLLASFAMGIFNMFVGIYLKEIGYEENIVGTILSLNVFAMAIASIPSAYLIEKIGRKRSFKLGFISIAIGSVFLVLFKNIFLIGLMAIINGFGMSVKNTAEGMYITENTKEEERISIFSINFIVSNIGMMSASFIGGILSTYMSKYFTSQQSITYIFIISAILSILAFIPIYFMKEPKNLQSRNFKQCLQGYNHVISDRKVLYFMMYYLVIGIGAGMVVPFFSVYLKYSMNISDSIVGSILSISQFGCILGGSLIPFMSNKFGKSNSVIICQLISIPFLLSIAFPQGIILIAISFFMRNGLMNMATPLTQNLSMELVDKKDRTNLSSMISLCSNISRAIGISIGGVMMEKISYNSPYYLTVILYIIGVVIFANLYKKESKLVRQKKYKEEHAFRH